MLGQPDDVVHRDEDDDDDDSRDNNATMMTLLLSLDSGVEQRQQRSHLSSNPLLAAKAQISGRLFVTWAR